jgi:O-antigen ligase
MIWLVGTLILLPVDLIKLPLNIILVDCWILMGLPILGLSFIRGRHVMNLSYAVAMWLILLASFASTFAAPSAANSLIVILKEVYAYVWFVVLIAVLANLDAKDFQRILIIWAGVVFAHGLLIMAQFLSPTFWQLTASLANRRSEFELYRSSGLFTNANSAAFYQVLGFVPLVLATPSQKIGMILGVLLLPTVLLTGSMGATLAFLTGLMVAIMAIFFIGRLALIIKMFVRLAIVILLLGGLLYFVVSHNERYRAHFEHIFLGRAERSSEGRFDLWLRGSEAFVDHGVLLWGVGPENFREVDAKVTDNQLHNDFLAFLVERGLVGVLGLGLLAALAAGRAAYMVRLYNKFPDRAQLTVVVFLGAIAAAGIESLTHQIFHFRALWLVLAFQEAILFRMVTSESGVAVTTRALNESPAHRPAFAIQPNMTGR